ncbi:CHAT domain-containing protein [Agrobacterium vitis]|uniref:CHAT domain-containing protein n=1 Tax=Agrobacterium vitis TaxID=373 RepID=UPI003D2B4598
MRELTTEPIVNNRAHLSSVVRSTIALRIRGKGADKGEFEFDLFNGETPNEDGCLTGLSNLTSDRLGTYAQNCRQAWDTAFATVYFSGGVHQKPLHERWDTKDVGAFVDRSIMPKLAQAGDKLFKMIFEADQEPEFRRIGERLRVLMAERPQFLNITTDTFFAPWSLIYTHPIAGERLKSDGSNWQITGFWGYQHLLQHSSNRNDMMNILNVDADGTVTLGVNFDHQLLHSMQKLNAGGHIEELPSNGRVRRIVRTTRKELAEVFYENRTAVEKVLYFLCHSASGETELDRDEAHLLFEDGTVSASDLKSWSVEHPQIPSKPFVFLNACKGARVLQQHHKSLAKELVSEGAAGVVGSHIDVPIVFASEFARRLLTRFLEHNSTEGPMFGPLMNQTVRELYDAQKNPIGLSYGLFHGVSCFIAWDNSAAH